MGIEKIGLPAKPAARGSVWVLDASSCQTCQTPFTIFNRKHHCRRCGGLFCGNCTNSKVTLRGQGDGPVRVCDPCKQIEEAARFQLRNKGKQAKGLSKGSSLAEDESALKEILDDSTNDGIGETDGQHEQVDQNQSDLDQIPEKKVTSPEKLREEAAESRKTYAALKQQGKNAEALRAYKRHKELGREADALELALKKAVVSQRKNKEERVTNADDKQESDKEVDNKPKEETSQSTTQSSQGVPKTRKASTDLGDDDLLQSLKDLGWNEADLSAKKAKRGPTSDLDLLAEISGSVPGESRSKKPTKENPTQLEILAHKRRALALKREGKPAEAKDELRKAKLLERKLEEMALMEGEDEDEDDDDELALLMRSLEKEAKTGKGKNVNLPPSEIDTSLPFNLADDDDDPNVEVTDDDINDPSIIEALQSVGWVEEAGAMQRSRAPETAGPEAFRIANSVGEQSSLQSQILTIKRAALALKREGKFAEAKAKLQEAKVLEQKLELSKSQPIAGDAVSSGKGNRGSKPADAIRLEDILADRDEAVEVDEGDMRDPEMMAALKAMGFEEDEEEPPLQTIVQPSAQERKRLQDEVLTIKRSALALRKQGKAEEAREEVRRAQALEQKLQKMQAELEKGGLPPAMVKNSGNAISGGNRLPNQLPLGGFVSEDEEDEDVGVTADDFMDPELVAALKSVGWQEEDALKKDPKPADEPDSAAVSDELVGFTRSQDTKPLSRKEHVRTQEIRRDLLAHKRKALALKREGKVEEAKLELKQARALEHELEKIEDNAVVSIGDHKDSAVLGSKPSASQTLPTPIGDEYDDGDEERVTDADMQDPDMLSTLYSFGWTAPERSAGKAESADQLHTAAAQSKRSESTVEKPSPTAAKLDVTNPPYTKAAADAATDPIWLSIMNSSRKSYQFEEKEVDGADVSVGENFNGGGFEQMGLPEDTVARHKAENRPSSTSATVTSADLLSGEAWEPHSQTQAPESDDDEDVFDAGLMAALQGIGLVPPGGSSKPSREQVSSEMSQKDKLTNTRAKMETNREAGLDSAVPPDERRERLASSLEAAKTSPGNSSNTSLPPGAVGFAPVYGDATNTPRTPAPASAQSSSTSGSPESDLQSEIKMHKRKALALKREGKLNEAKDELVQARVLEKQLNKSSPEISTSVSKGTNAAASTSPEVGSQAALPKPKTSAPSMTHKEQMRQEVRQGKDRKKLQQESLAHKRKALALRREGKTDEADAEFELAKDLEKQMEELDGGAKAAGLGPGDMGLVEGLLDPQLMAALQGIGFSDGELRGGAPSTTAGNSATSTSRHQATSSQQSTPAEARSFAEAKPSNRVQEHQATGKSSKTESSIAAGKMQTERKQLEDRIKQEKLKALELKRAGRQVEAIEALKNAKKLEKQLGSLGV